MNCDDLLGLQYAEVPEVVNEQALLTKKERLYSLAACGKTKQFLGTELSIEQIQQMSAQDIEKYHGRYESQLGSRMVKSVGQTVLSLYTKVVGRFVPIDSEQDFMFDLAQDPVLTKSLESLACDFYYRFGTLLAPIITGLITFNHINFNYIKNERAREPANEQAGEPEGESGTNPADHESLTDYSESTGE
eukprot:TRINITY_DN441_c0_g2_i3.p1 TRINITY_DN441_c0_g2~~TRINITY_DN441_c0_g2_i3.p1  ORF type:complete len:190 (-),score=7.85 TRINITY_DN441_c0_g2_i3:178-747(-)